MNTTADLKAMIPSIAELFGKSDHQMGKMNISSNAGGIKEETEGNLFVYDEAGWLIEVEYDCTGIWDCDPGDYWTPASCDLVAV